METVCGNVVKRIELEKRLNQLKVGFGHMTHICCMQGADFPPLVVERVEHFSKKYELICTHY